MILLLLLSLLAEPYSEERARAVLEAMRKDSGRHMSVDPVDGQFFYRLTLELRAKRVLEIGTAAGYSGGWFAMALKKTGGRLITLEIDPERHAAAVKNFAAMGVADIVEARLANALTELPKIEIGRASCRERV